ncbi:MAG: hypothetical protein HUU15_17935 [Candidatus Brocadiae bacterium]|nr:hypothetical protein [Candidatus Brocadiia bacterium]
MLRRAALIAPLLLAAASQSRADFGTSLEEAEKESRSRGKLMLVYIWSPACHVCKGLNEKVWPNLAVQTELENWSAVKVDSNDAVKSKYRWKVDDVPQIRVIDPEGNEFRTLTRSDIPGGNSPDKMVEALQSLRQAWDDELAGRKFEWESGAAEAKTKSKERGRPIAWFASEAASPGSLNRTYPQFTDKVPAAASKKFVCVPVSKANTDFWEKYKPQVVPGFVFTDLDGVELHRCGLLSGEDLAKEFDLAAAKFEATNIVDPAKALERALANWDAALRGQVEQDKLDAGQKVIDANEPKTVKALARGFADPSIKVKEMLIPAMTGIDVQAGLPELIKWVQKETNTKLAVKGWDAVGQTGDLRAVPALTDNVLDAQSAEVSNARIRALGNMRDKKVVDFLVELPFKIKGKGRGPGGGGGQRQAIKNSLNKLTGQDFGEDWLEWKKWWRDNQKAFKFE